jgi:hypothetical protein
MNKIKRKGMVWFSLCSGLVMASEYLENDCRKVLIAYSLKVLSGGLRISDSSH